MADTIRVIITRQAAPGAKPYTQTFDVEHVPDMNVISILQEIRRNPVDVKGTKVEPVAWDCNCLEEVCGACTMNINGEVKQACSTLVDHLEQPIRLAPMTKFPVVRDLVVDRSQMFQNLKRIRGWVPIDGLHDLGPGPRMSEKERQAAYEFSRCMTCGCCLEACPQFNAIEGDPEKDAGCFVGATIIGQVRYFNSHPTGAMLADERLDELMGPGGIADCGNAQNCARVCPKEIPLLDAIAEMGWDTTKRSFKKLLG